jgi:WD40 repeat protein
LAGHTGPVFNVAFSPDSKQIATGSGDNTVIIWDVETGEAIGEPLTGHQAAILGLAFSPDGQMIASGGVDSTVRLWDSVTGQQLQLFGDHNAMVNSVEFSPDGSLLTSGDLNGTAIIWDSAVSGSLFTQRIDGLGGGINKVAYGDDETLISAGVDGFIRFWNASQGIQIGEPLRHSISESNSVESLVFSPDGQILASGGDNGTIMLWDVETGESISPTISAAVNEVTQLVFSSDSNAIINGSSGGFLASWDLNNGAQIGPFLAGHTDRVGAVAFSPDGQYLASGSDDGTLVIRQYSDVLAGQGLADPISYTASVTSSVTALSFNPNSTMLASADDLGLLSLWDPVNSQILTQTQNSTPRQINTMAFSPDGELLAVGDSKGKLTIYNTRALSTVAELTLYPDHGIADLIMVPAARYLLAISADGATQLRDLQSLELITGMSPIENITGDAIAVNPSGDKIAYSLADGLIGLTDIGSGTMLNLPMSHDALFQGPVTDLIVSPDGTFFVTAGNDGSIVIWDRESLAPIGAPLRGHSSVVMGLAISPDGTKLASGGCSQFHYAGNCLVGEVLVWDLTSRQMIAQMRESQTFTPGLAFSPDGSVLAYSDCDSIEVAAQCLEGAVQIWDYQTGQLLDRYSGHTGVIWSIDYSPDGKILATASADNTVSLWDTSTGQPMGQRLTNHGGPVRRLTFSPDGTMLASAGFDNLVILWDVMSGQAFGGSFVGHTGVVMDIRFDPQGRTLSSASLDGSIIFWDVDFDSWLDKACEIANRNLRTEEWEQFMGNREYHETCLE